MNKLFTELINHPELDDDDQEYQIALIEGTYHEEDELQEEELLHDIDELIEDYEV